MTMVNSYQPENAKLLADEERQEIARRERLIGPGYRLFYQKPLRTVASDGVWLIDAAGRRYLDAYNNVPSLGHCNPLIVEAAQKQALRLNTHSRYIVDVVLDYAESLLGTFPKGLERVMFTCSGSEANDLALRMAREYTGGSGIIATEYAYHGVTGDCVEISPSLGKGVVIPDHVRLIAAPNTYRSAKDEIASLMKKQVEEAVEDFRQKGIKPAALILDSIFTSDGMFPRFEGLSDVVAAARASGMVYIADEVQSGFARTGTYMWAFQRHGVLPDIVTMGKPMGNGYPISGLVAKPAILDHFGARLRYFNTHGGNPVCCAAGQAVLDFIAQHDLIDQTRIKGEFLKSAMNSLADRFEAIGDVRGEGLFLSVELVKDRTTKEPDPVLATQIVNSMRENGILISSSGRAENILKIRPLLTFEQDHLDQLLEGLEGALKLCTKGSNTH